MEANTDLRKTDTWYVSAGSRPSSTDHNTLGTYSTSDLCGITNYNSTASTEGGSGWSGPRSPQGQTSRTWDGGSGTATSWNLTANWNPDSTPAENDNLIFPTPVATFITNTASLSNFTCANCGRVPALGWGAVACQRNWPSRRKRSPARAPFALGNWIRSSTACASGATCGTAVATLMGSSGYQAFENTCKKFTQRQLKALGCQRDKEGCYAAPSDSTFFRVITQLDAAHSDSVVGAWLLEQAVSVLERLAVTIQ